MAFLGQVVFNDPKGFGAVPNRTPPTGVSVPRRGPLMVCLAALVVLAGVPIHLYWAHGGTWGYPAARPRPACTGLHRPAPVRPGGASHASRPGMASVWFSRAA
jgi:hypothetical protein